MKNYIYCRISRGWMSEHKDKWIGKLGSTRNIMYRKWMGATERLYPSVYKWFLIIKDLGRFSNVKSAEYTVFRHPFFKDRHMDNGPGSGDEFFEFNEYDNSLKKVCEILVQYDVVFSVCEGDPYKEKPKNIPKEEELDEGEGEPLPLITKQKSKTIEYRKYQQDIVEKMLNNNIGTIVLATGLGKTVVFCLYIKKKGGRYLIIVPTTNLVDQTINTCQKIIGSDFKYYKYEKGNAIPNIKNLIVVGTYQNSHNLKEIENIDCIIFDECHNTVVLNPPKNDEEKITLSRFQLLLDYRCDKFFFTATEKNIISDGSIISMDNREKYGYILYKYELEQAITDGYLTDYTFHLVATDNKKLSAKQYVESGYKSVIFCAYQSILEELYLYLKENLSKDIRIFKLGKHDDVNRNTKLFSEYKGRSVIVSVKKINMGYDEPQIDTIIHFDISISSIMTVQRNGRALRLNDDKVMATLVFLCDLSGDEESRKDEIKKLQRPISYLKSIDSRLEKRIEKELMKGVEEFKTVDIKVDGDFKDERKQIYDRCWNILNKGLNYEEVKEIIRKNDKVYCKCDYKQICETDGRLPINPEETFDNFLGWVDYLSIDTSRYYTIAECKQKIEEYKETISKYIKITEKCQHLCRIDPLFPPIDMWVEIYRLQKIDDIFVCEQQNTAEEIPKWLSKKNLKK